MATPNTPYDHNKHWPLLKAVAPGARKLPADAFGASSSNAHWFEAVMPAEQAGAFRAKCDELGIYHAADSYYPRNACEKLCKYVREPN
jgi:hypothetical protein